MVAQTSYAINTAKYFHGDPSDLRDSEVETYAAESSDIGFGIAVSRGTDDDQAVIGGAAAAIGVTMRDLGISSTVPGSAAALYEEDAPMSVMRRGAINLALASGGNAGDPLHYNDTTGVIDAGAAGGATTGAIVAGGGNTGDGVAGAVTPAANAILGDYLLECVNAAVSGSEIFSVIDPEGNRLDDLVVAVAYSNTHFALTIADGAADFVVGDTFTITMAPTVAGESPLVGAELLTDVAAGAVGVVRLTGQI